MAQAELLDRSRAINALLETPIGLLPSKLGEPIRPFRVGVGAEIVARRRPDVPDRECEKALRSYARSFAYRLAIAQPGSMRHDIDGNPVEPVNDTDRQHAQRSIRASRGKSKPRKPKQAIGGVIASAVSGDPDRTGDPPVPLGPPVPAGR